VAAASAADFPPRGIAYFVSILNFEINITNVHGTSGTFPATADYLFGLGNANVVQRIFFRLNIKRDETQITFLLVRKETRASSLLLIITNLPCWIFHLCLNGLSKPWLKIINV
jgi:hypothetical protein